LAEAEIVVDTSAVMTLILEEEGADLVEQLVHESERVHVPFMTLMEVEYKLRQIRPGVEVRALGMIAAWDAVIHESHERWRRLAARLKATVRLSLGDAWVASLALIAEADLVHKDPQFENVPDLKMVRLPYKERGARS
jgi:predicted nucleic acid-binding protein